MGIFDGLSKALEKAAETAAGAVDVASGVAQKAVNAASDATSAVAYGAKVAGIMISDGVSAAGSAVVDSAVGKAAADVVETVSNAAGTATDAIVEGAKTVGNTVADGAAAAGNAISESAPAKAISGAVDSAAQIVKENSREYLVKVAKTASFKDGIHQGIYMGSEKHYAYSYALMATLFYFLRVDGEFSDEEKQWVSNELSYLRKTPKLPSPLRINSRKSPKRKTYLLRILDPISIR